MYRPRTLFMVAALIGFAGAACSSNPGSERDTAGPSGDTAGLANGGSESDAHATDTPATGSDRDTNFGPTDTADTSQGDGDTADTSQGSSDTTDTDSSGADSAVFAIDPPFAAATSVAVHSSVLPDLDLRHLVATPTAAMQPMPVPPAPAIVAGEGPDPANRTVVRVFDRYGVLQTQFLAYPTDVTGGVGVHAGVFGEGEVGLVVHPLSAQTPRPLRFYDLDGVLRGELPVDDTLRAPFAVAVGEFDAECSGDELLVASAQSTGPSLRLVLYAPTCARGRRIAIADTGATGGTGPVALATQPSPTGDRVLITLVASRRVLVVDPASPAVVQHALTIEEPVEAVAYPSPFAEDELLLATKDADLSFVYRIDGNGRTLAKLDVGRRENCMWIQNDKYKTDSPEDRQAWPGGTYVRRGRFVHLRSDAQSPVYTSDTVDPANDTYAYWVDESKAASSTSAYFDGEPTLWEPTFTHRQFPHIGAYWRTSTYPGTDLPMYLQLKQDNTPAQSASWDVSANFEYLTYAPNLPAVDKLYMWPLRAVLRHLAGKYRGENGDPDQMVGISPNHEMEMEGGGAAVGDYNPNNIVGFRAYLATKYGPLSHINQRFGTSFTEDTFDAPRNQGRGDWDAYDTANDFFIAWLHYNRTAILSWIAKGFREALWAGFPPELIKTHQIPMFNTPQTVIATHRISPVDWILSAGASFGATRYSGNFHTKEDNFIRRAFDSGHTLITLGEYSARLPMEQREQAYDQLAYIYDHGGTFIHHMTDHGNALFYPDTGLYAMNKLAGEERPRPGTTGGVGAIRAVCQPTETGCTPMAIAVIGTGSRTGLLKSLREDGRFEGTVYLVPFHAHVEPMVVGPHGEDAAFTVSTQDYVSHPMTGLLSGDRVSVSFAARSADPDAHLTMLFLHSGVELPGHRIVMPVSATPTFYRVELTIQDPMDDMVVLINSGVRDTDTARKQSIEISHFSHLVFKERSSHPDAEQPSATPHRGSVTFDVISQDYRMR